MRKRFFIPFVTAVAFTSVLFQKAMAQNTSPYWSLAGNSNATSSSKLGTTNGINLRLYTNNAERVRITTSGLVGIGTTSPAQKLDVKGNINLAKGYGLYIENRRVLRVDSATMGVFLGNSTGNNNTGLSNTAAGSYALSSGASGAYNSAFGYAALNYNTSGYGNTAIGTYTLSLNTTASNNTAVGNQALYLNTTGFNNTATGAAALFSNATGEQNVAYGQGALTTNTAGSRNTAIGSEAMNETSTATENTAIGYRALLKNANGHYNVALGTYALAYNNSAQYNTAVGYYAGGRFFQGWNNTYIGSDADATANGIYNSVALGNYARVTASNQVRIGNAYTTSIGGYTTWTNISDGRVKRNIQDNVPGLAFINKLKPVTYNLDLDAADKITGAAAAKDKDGKTGTRRLSQMDIAARQAKQQVVYTGFIAQDVEKAAKDLGYNFSGVDAAKNEKDLYGLRYTDFIMPLVKAVQELSKENEELKSRLEKLEATANGNQSATSATQASKELSVSTATLGQNMPNPATGSTRITYTLPASKAQAQLLFTDALGRVIRNIPLHGSGYVELNTTTLSAGVYTYSLLLDGKIAATKKLTIAP